jgi:hypothetical protein
LLRFKYDQKNLAAKKGKKAKKTWLSGESENSRWSKGYKKAEAKRKKAAGGLNVVQEKSFRFKKRNHGI